MRKALITISVVALALGSARGDVVKIGRLSYKPVKITGFANEKVTFVLGVNPVTKPITAVVLITMDDKDAFNQAEELRAGDPQKAVGFYDTAAQAAWAPWEKDLIAYRRLDVLGRAGLTGRWAKEWVAVMAGGGGVGAARLRPGKLGEKSEIEAAIEHLERARDEVTDSRARFEIKAVLKLLRERLSTLEGSSQPPDQPDSTQGQPDNGQDVNGPDVPPTRPVEITGSSTGRLVDFEKMLKGGEAGRVIREIEGFLKKAKSNELARALFLGGLARMEVAKRAPARGQQLLREASLMFMKVAVLYPRSPDAPMSLYYAGQASERLGDAEGATAAYRALTAGGDPESDVFKQAAERLKALQTGQAEPRDEVKAAGKG